MRRFASLSSKVESASFRWSVASYKKPMGMNATGYSCTSETEQRTCIETVAGKRAFITACLEVVLRLAHG